MTNAKSLFPRQSFVGFEHLLNELDFIGRSANENYPPHNIVKVDKTNYLIEVACAGFAMEEIEIEQHERTLTVSASHEKRGRDYVHQGISQKSFKRQFRLSEYVHVDGASHKDGILSIKLKVVLPEEKRPRKINISNEETTNETEQQLS
jgi:molecular chaperone IbpA